MQIGDTITREQMETLPPGTVTESLHDGSRRTINDDGTTYRKHGGRDRCGFDALPHGHEYVIVDLRRPAHFTVGQEVTRGDCPRLPIGTVLTTTIDAGRRTIISDTHYRTEGGREYEFRSLGHFVYTIASLPNQKPKPTAYRHKVGTSGIDGHDLQDLPVGAVIRGDNDRKERTIVDGGEFIHRDGRRYPMARMTGPYTLLSLPDEQTRKTDGETIARGDYAALRALPDGTEVEVISTKARYVKSGDRMERIGDGRDYVIGNFNALVAVTWMPGMKHDGAWAVGQQVAAAQLKNLPVGTTFRRVGSDTDFLTVEGGDDRMGAGGDGKITHYVQPDQGIVNGGGLMRIDGLAGDFTIIGLPDDAVETLDQFKARVWRVTKPYRESGYTGEHTNRILRDLGITEPVPEDPALVQEFKDRMWEHIAGQAKDRGWCATWKKPLAELGISEPKPKTVDTTFTITIDPSRIDEDTLRQQLSDHAGVVAVNNK